MERVCRVDVRVSPVEKARIEAAAKLRGLGVSEFVRRAVVGDGGSLPPVGVDADDPRVARAAPTGVTVTGRTDGTSIVARSAAREAAAALGRPVSAREAVEMSAPEGSRGLHCPKCDRDYERGMTCLRCGEWLVRQAGR